MYRGGEEAEVSGMGAAEYGRFGLIRVKVWGRKGVHFGLELRINSCRII